MPHRHQIAMCDTDESAYEDVSSNISDESEDDLSTCCDSSVSSNEVADLLGDLIDVDDPYCTAFDKIDLDPTCSCDDVDDVECTEDQPLTTDPNQGQDQHAYRAKVYHHVDGVLHLDPSQDIRLQRLGVTDPKVRRIVEKYAANALQLFRKHNLCFDPTAPYFSCFASDRTADNFSTAVIYYKHSGDGRKKKIGQTGNLRLRKKLGYAEDDVIRTIINVDSMPMDLDQGLIDLYLAMVKEILEDKDVDDKQKTS